MDNLEVNLFNWNSLWDVAGPFIIMGITAVVLGIVFMIIINLIPRGILREIVRILAIVAIIGGSLLSLQIAANIWSH
ncbi:hypothetical protein [Gracilibacillus salinarum]|uniref:DUF2768 domain-containing protein n=1 Tax=Gracilibacillus salinarum TaxID=2932255 RepID=A0ABY4GPN6_9BACI|nr:hypothetical protein [Gracilibacillus salinarum]UOQ85682.1 hypothetical protein MUN87_01885 [Gracilibacillus salinarum]